MAASRSPGRYRPGHGSSGSALAVLALVIAIVVIAVTLAVLRARQHRADQARYAMEASVRLVTAADAWTPPLLPPQGGVVPARTAGKRPARPPSARRRGTAGSPRSGPRL